MPNPRQPEKEDLHSSIDKDREVRTEEEDTITIPSFSLGERQSLGGGANGHLDHFFVQSDGSDDDLDFEKFMAEDEEDEAGGEEGEEGDRLDSIGAKTNDLLERLQSIKFEN